MLTHGERVREPYVSGDRCRCCDGFAGVSELEGVLAALIAKTAGVSPDRSVVLCWVVVVFIDGDAISLTLWLTHPLTVAQRDALAVNDVDDLPLLHGKSPV